MSPAEPDDAPRLAEIGRLLTDFRSEMRAALAHLLPREVYDVQRAADLDRVRRLETWQETTLTERRSLGRQATIAVLAAVLSMVCTIVVALVTRA